MAQLDVSPMISALQSNPDHFEFTTGSLHHIPSRHRFRFDAKGLTSIDAICGCASLEVSREQEALLFEAYNNWTVDYWRPLQTNRQFAAHFHLPLWRRILIALTGRLHRALLAQSREHHVQEALTSPAE
jgi:hypothetical protein